MPTISPSCTAGSRCASPMRGEALTLLDGRTINAEADLLLIADEQGPVGLAGIMGGERTAVSAETRAMFSSSPHSSRPQAVLGRARRFGLTPMPASASSAASIPRSRRVRSSARSHCSCAVDRRSRGRGYRDRVCAAPAAARAVPLRAASSSGFSELPFPLSASRLRFRRLQMQVDAAGRRAGR